MNPRICPRRIPRHVGVPQRLLSRQPLVWVENQQTSQEVQGVGRNRRLEKILQRHLRSGERGEMFE